MKNILLIIYILCWVSYQTHLPAQQFLAVEDVPTPIGVDEGEDNLFVEIQSTTETNACRTLINKLEVDDAAAEQQL